jgi:integrase
MAKLTELLCRNATSEGKKLKKYFDGDGLYLWVYETGSKRWSFRYSLSSREKSLSLGTYPKVSLAEARKEARRAQTMLDRGVDTFEHVAMDWYTTMLPKWKNQKHAEDVLRRLKKNLFPYLGPRPMTEIESLEVLSVLKIVEKRGATDLSHRLLGVCSQIFVYGIIHKKCKFDVTSGLVRALTPHKPQHQKAVTREDLPALMQKIDSDNETMELQTKIALKILAHTFVRTNELIYATWDEFDFEQQLWSIPPERMKMANAHVVPLTFTTVKLFKQLKKIAGNSDFVLPGRIYLKTISNNTLLFALYRLGYKGRMTGHGFRSVASTVLNEAGFRGDIVEKQLAHVDKDKVRAAYNRAHYLVERREMMCWWSNYLNVCEKGGTPPQFFDNDL